MTRKATVLFALLLMLIPIGYAMANCSGTTSSGCAYDVTYFSAGNETLTVWTCPDGNGGYNSDGFWASGDTTAGQCALMENV